MWEFCITIENDKTDIINFVFEKFTEYKNEYDIVVTKNQTVFKTHILIACNNFEKTRTQNLIQNTICEVVCFYIKKDFLNSNLKVSTSDEIVKQAFVFALLFFDKETDNYIVCKYLTFENKLDVDGFFNFKLKTLREKWLELVSIANQNDVYLCSSESFIELIKFLVDNLEIKNEVINIMQQDESFDLFDYNFEKLENEESLNNVEENLIARLIANCPKSINIHCSENLPSNLKDIICKLFEKRVKFISKI